MIIIIIINKDIIINNKHKQMTLDVWSDAKPQQLLVY